MTVAAGDASARPLEGVSIRLVPLDGRRRGAAVGLMRSTDIGGSSRATLAAGRAAVLVRRLGYDTHDDTVAVRAGYSDTLSLRLRPVCEYLEASTQRAASP